MISSPLVLVLGAGASKPYGFPLGSELRTKALQDDPELLRAILAIGFTEQHILDFKEALRYSAETSIDAFLELRHEFVDVGKAFIASLLIRCEVEHKLYDTENRDGWYDELYQLIRVTDLGRFRENKLTIVTFNYDRSLEFKISKAISSAHNLDVERCAEAMTHLPIVHVHGSLGELDTINPNGVPFDPDLSPPRIEMAMQSIKVVHEDLDTSAEFTVAANSIFQAKHVLFLGFGYHGSNVQRLRVAAAKARARMHEELGETVATPKIFGTRYGIRQAESDQRIVPLFKEAGGINLLPEATSIAQAFESNTNLFLTTESSAS